MPQLRAPQADLESQAPNIQPSTAVISHKHAISGRQLAAQHKSLLHM